MHHLKRHDYSRWFRKAIDDEDLAREAREIEDGGADTRASRAALRRLISRRYTVPAEPG